MTDERSLAEKVAVLPLEERRRILDELAPTDLEKALLEYNWKWWARPKQLEPEGGWFIWLLCSGRAFGKTRSGSEWIRKRVEQGAKRIALVGRTAGDVRDVMVLGESGILACYPPEERPKFEPTKRCVTWPNGAQAHMFSADRPDQLRGPNFDTGWIDELAAHRYPDAYDQLRLSVRSAQSGLRPRIVVTTTPRATPLMKKLLKDPTVHVTRGGTRENAANIATTFIEEVERIYGGTRLGRQELDGELLEDNPNSIFNAEWIEAARIQDAKEAPKFDRIVVAIDPAVSTGTESAETGIITVGIADTHIGNGKYVRHAYVLEDISGTYTPDEWAGAALKAYRVREADALVAEVNNGGDLVKNNIRQVDDSVRVVEVRASRGKAVRAEPISTLYEQGRVHHIGCFPKLEDQMAEWVPGDRKKKSDRMDALVWGIWELMIQNTIGTFDGDDPDETTEDRREKEAREALLSDPDEEDFDDWAPEGF